VLTEKEPPEIEIAEILTREDRIESITLSSDEGEIADTSMDLSSIEEDTTGNNNPNLPSSSNQQLSSNSTPPLVSSPEEGIAE